MAASPDQNIEAEKLSDKADAETKNNSEETKPTEATVKEEVAENQKNNEDQSSPDAPKGDHKAETNENASYETEGEELEGGQADGDDDDDDDEGAMDASQFLEMAQAENEDESEMPYDKTGEAFIKEEPEENEDNIEDDSGNELIRKKKRKSNLGPSDVKLEAPEGDEEMDQSVNGTMEVGDYMVGESGDDYEEGDDLAEDNYDDDKVDNSGMKLEDTGSKEGHEEGDDEGGEKKDDVKKKLRSRQKRKVLVEDDTDESEEERKKKRKKRKKKGGKIGSHVWFLHESLAHAFWSSFMSSCFPYLYFR